jgi:hypothetical protein
VTARLAEEKMARIFLSYDPGDRDLARALEKGLAAKGHVSVWGVDELIAGRGWGELMPARLASADAVVAILTKNSEHSSSVWCEVGAARALAGPKRTALLPVIVGLDKAPSYVRDILSLWCKSGAEKNLDSPQNSLVIDIDRAIGAHLAALQSEAGRAAWPKIFISHRHKDSAVARALTEALNTAFDTRPSDIRCTSVQPYRLPFGKNTGERLRDEINHAKAVLGILAPDTAQSSYVMFELGAAWAQRIYTVPLLSQGAGFTDIPGPIFDLSPARLWMDADCHQLVQDLAAEVALKRRDDAQGQLSEKIGALARLAGQAASDAPSP